MLDAILDGLGDIFEPIADKININRSKIEDLKQRYSVKWALYLFKILVATFMIGSAFINMFINQSFYYTVNENGIWKVISNFVKLALAMYMFQQFSKKMGYIKGIAAEKTEKNETPLTKMGMTSNDNDLEGFGGYYDMFRSQFGNSNF